MRPTPAMAGLAAALVLCIPAQAMAGIACKPALTFKEVRFSEAHNHLRKWTGILSVDASHCAATSGPFEIKFVRLKEVGPDLLCTERFEWRAGLDQVAVDVWSDEAVHLFYIGDVLSCG